MTESFVPLNSSQKPITIQSTKSANANNGLLYYVIKASYNSAYDGQNISLTALDNVLARGCRFLDLEIYSIDEVPCVAYSTDKTFSTLTSGNYLSLSTVLTEIAGNCFTGNVPNNKDPLFLHLRVNTTCGLTNEPACDIYQKIATIINTTIFSQLYTDSTGLAIPITGTTILSDLMGKIVIIMDTSIQRDYRNYAVCSSVSDSSDNIVENKCKTSFKNLVNIETGGTMWKKYKYSDFIQMSSNPLTIDSTNPQLAEPKQGTLALSLVLPDVGTNVQNASFPISNIVSFGCQTIALKFYQDDLALGAYEALFNQYGSAFVPIGYAIQYINESQQ